MSMLKQSHMIRNLPQLRHISTLLTEKSVVGLFGGVSVTSGQSGMSTVKGGSGTVT